MIPKKIHYCWFGKNAKNQLTQKCMESWRRYCPDFEIIEWNEDNFDLDQHPYLRWCYDNKKWAFLSDFARLLILEEYGGIYLDTDVELVRNPDELFQYEAFYGFENKKFVNTGEGFGCIPHHKTVTALRQEYSMLIPDSEGRFPIMTCPNLNTKALLPLGLVLNGKRQNVAGAEILPIEYLNPYDDPTGTLHKTENTVSIHWYGKSWMSKKTILRSQLTKPFHKIFGVDCFDFLKRRNT